MELPDAGGDRSRRTSMQRVPGRVLSLLLSLFFPTTLLAVMLLLLAAGNGFLSLASDAGAVSSSSSQFPARFLIRESMPRSPAMAVEEDAAPPKPPVLQKPRLLHGGRWGTGPRYYSRSTNHAAAPRRKGWSSPTRARALRRLLLPGHRAGQFVSRAERFFNGSGGGDGSSPLPPCKARFFMTWISSLESFGKRELFAVESLFKSQPDACLLVLSGTMDSAGGETLLEPFLRRGFRAAAMSPDYPYLFKNTPAEAWFAGLRKGRVDPGKVPLGQNLSNLLRLAALYKFGGAYVDTDVVVTRSFAPLRNVIGAQTVDLSTGNWSRLNNAVMVFDRKHPLLYQFIREFAATFDGNKWGHNGPYLVSRVAARVAGRPGFRFEVLPPSAFYPIGWTKIRDLFRAPRRRAELGSSSAELRRIIRERSFAVHLWNRRSRKIRVEEGSVIAQIMSDCCIFCNVTSTL